MTDNEQNTADDSMLERSENDQYAVQKQPPTEREPEPMPQGGDYTDEERILFALEHQTDQLERMADALEAIAVNHDKLQNTQYGMLAVMDGQSVTFGDEATQEASDSQQADVNGTDDYTGKQEAKEAAEKLQAAFDEQCEGMEVHVKDGVLWPNNTPEAPNWTFKAFMKDVDTLRWDNEGEYEHPLVGPNDYELENYLEPSAVDDYIQEVIE